MILIFLTKKKLSNYNYIIFFWSFFRKIYKFVFIYFYYIKLDSIYYLIIVCQNFESYNQIHFNLKKRDYVGLELTINLTHPIK